LNGRLQRIAQRLTSLIALFPTSLGQKTMANGFAVTIASDQSAIPSSQSGTWNINNVSGTVSLPTGASTSANQSTMITNMGAVADAAVTNPASSASIIAALKGLLTLSQAVLISHETQTVGTSTVTFTAPANAKYMAIQNSTRASASSFVRVGLSSATVTSASGYCIEPGQAPTVWPASSIKFISDVANGGDVTVVWFG